MNVNKHLAYCSRWLDGIIVIQRRRNNSTLNNKSARLEKIREANVLSPKKLWVYRATVNLSLPQSEKGPEDNTDPGYLCL